MRHYLQLLLPAALLVSCAQAAAKESKGMTYAEAKARIPARELPPFWVGDVADFQQRWARLQRGAVRTIATTPSGRPLHLIAFGAREETVRRANFNSAVGARHPASYMDKAARKKPVILFVGPVHGHETEALTGLVNLVEVMETGNDLRGKAHAGLRAAGEKCRLLIIPAGNPDGVARFEARALQGMEHDDIRFWGQGTWADGTFCDWPECKRQHPMTGDNVAFLGCYFNDAGVNPMHDEFLNPMGPESSSILKVAQEEGPDLAVSLHSHASTPTLLRPSFVPLEVQGLVADLARECYALCDERGLPHGRPFEPQAEKGDPPAPFNLTSALYHISGATVLTFECPHGVRGEKTCHVSFEQILDIQLTLYEAMVRYALRVKGA